MYKYLALGTLGAVSRYLIDLRRPRNERKYNDNYHIPPRSQQIENLESDEFDMLIIGGGANGAGVALEASTRGLKSAVIDIGDFAGQTSSKSSKLIHGGIRYLEQAFMNPKKFRENMELVSEALRERNIMIKSAEYMNSAISMSIPNTTYFKQIYAYVGMWVYHVIAVIQAYTNGEDPWLMPAPGFETASKMQEKFPLLKPGYIGAVKYSDGQFNDARHCITALLTAAAQNYIEGQVPAVIANYVEFVEFNFDESGKINGAMIADKITGKKITVKAKSVINCAGPFADAIRQKADPSVEKRIATAKGSHFMLPGSYAKHSFVIPKTTDGRILFIIPWRGNTLVGTTDFETPEPDFHNVISQQEIDFMCKELSVYFNKPAEEIAKDIMASYSGQRPLVRQAGSTKEMSRSHVVELLPKSGLISVMGGKWTTYRYIGEDAVEQIIAAHDLKPTYKSRTDDYKLIGSGSKTLPRLPGMDDDVLEHMYYDYGSRASEVLQLAPGGNSRITPGLPYLKSEIINAIRNEYALTLSDICCRRMRMSFEDVGKTRQAIGIVAEIAAKELGWTEEQKTEEIRKVQEELNEYKVS